MGHAAGAPKFRKFGCRCSLCAITGIFPYKYPVFAFYTGFINLGRNRRVDKKIAPNCSFPTHVLLCVLLLKNYKNNAYIPPSEALSKEKMRLMKESSLSGAYRGTKIAPWAIGISN